MGSKLPRLSATLARFGLRRGPDLPQADPLARTFVADQAPGLPMFARHEYRARARNKWAARGAARRWCGKLKSRAAGEPESRPARLPVRHLVREFVGVGEAIAHRLGIDRLRRKCLGVLRTRRKRY